MTKAVKKFKVILKMQDKNGDGFGAVNPLKVAESLEIVGESFDAPVFCFVFSVQHFLFNVESRSRWGKQVKLQR